VALWRGRWWGGGREEQWITSLLCFWNECELVVACLILSEWLEWGWSDLEIVMEMKRGS